MPKLILRTRRARATLLTGTVLGAVLAMASLTPARAADDMFCREYARDAEREVHAARDFPACHAGTGGPRWSGDYNVHFNWCRGADRAVADRERHAREEHLSHCGHDRDHDRGHEHDHDHDHDRDHGHEHDHDRDHGHDHGPEHPAPGHPVPPHAPPPKHPN